MPQRRRYYGTFNAPVPETFSDWTQMLSNIHQDLFSNNQGQWVDSKTKHAGIRKLSFLYDQVRDIDRKAFKHPLTKKRKLSQEKLAMLDKFFQTLEQIAN